MDYIEKKKRELNRYKGLIIDVSLDLAESYKGETIFREVVHHPGGVSILPVDDQGYAYLVRQFRYPIQRHLIEIPAGKLEKGEDPRECAIRELGEETGFTAGELIDMGRINSTPGFCNEVLYLYLALDLQRGEQHLDPHEYLDVQRVPLSELVEKALSGELEDGKTVIGVLRAANILKNRS